MSLACADPNEARYIGGSGGQWTEPANWESGSLPGPDDDVVIDGDAILEAGTDEIEVRDIEIEDGASLTVVGSTLRFRDVTVGAGSQLEAQSSALLGSAIRGRGGGSGILLNPSLLQVQTLDLGALSAMTFGLGGSQRARSPGGVGAGYHARLIADQLSGDDVTLELELLYDYQPSGGEVLVIAELGTDGSTFAGLAEGDIVMAGTTAFTISYQGGDGNDIALTALAPQ
jgi:hypothetical protein